MILNPPPSTPLRHRFLILFFTKVDREGRLYYYLLPFNPPPSTPLGIGIFSLLSPLFLFSLFSFSLFFPSAFDSAIGIFSLLSPLFLFSLFSFSLFFPSGFDSAQASVSFLLPFNPSYQTALHNIKHSLIFAMNAVISSGFSATFSFYITSFF